MESQADVENPQPITIELEFVPEDERDADPAAVGEVGRSVIEALTQDGYTVQPVYTGERGGFLLAIPLVLLLAGQAIAANKDLLIELLKTVQPVIAYVFRGRDKKAS